MKLQHLFWLGLVLQTLLPSLIEAGGRAPESCRTRLQNIVLDNTFRSKSRKAVTRDLFTYVNAFSELDYFRSERGLERDRTWEELLQGSQDTKLHFLDLGAGDGIFARELAGVPHERLIHDESQSYIDLMKENFPNVTAVSVKTDGPIENGTRYANFRFLVGRYFEDITPQELTGEFGKINVVTDFWGALAYSGQPDTILRKLLSVMGSDGVIFLKQRDLVSSLDNSTVVRSTQSLKFSEWLAGIEGLVVESDIPSYGGTQATFHIRIRFKQGVNLSDIVIPKLVLEGVDEKTMPPGRHFREIK